MHHSQGFIPQAYSATKTNPNTPILTKQTPKDKTLEKPRKINGSNNQQHTTNHYIR